MTTQPKMEYQVIQADSLEALMKKVNVALASGWVPQGGVCVAATPESFSSYGTTQYFQAIVKNP